MVDLLWRAVPWIIAALVLAGCAMKCHPAWDVDAENEEAELFVGLRCDF